MDAEPHPEGTFIIEWVGEEAYATYAGKGQDRHQSHFATCEQVDQFRSEGGKK